MKGNCYSYSVDILNGEILVYSLYTSKTLLVLTNVSHRVLNLPDQDIVHWLDTHYSVIIANAIEQEDKPNIVQIF